MWRELACRSSGRPAELIHPLPRILEQGTHAIWLRNIIQERIELRFGELVTTRRLIQYSQTIVGSHYSVQRWRINTVKLTFITASQQRFILMSGIRAVAFEFVHSG